MLLHSVFKYLVHLLTGQCELERIISRHYHPGGDHHALMVETRQSLKRSKQLKSEALLLVGPNPKQAPNSASIVQAIAVCKRLPPKVQPGLQSVVESLAQTTSAVLYLSELAQQQFSHEHDMEMLEELWNSLKPGQELQGGNPRRSQSWGEIGFQGVDPATDFRGGGLLALENLRYFASKAETCELARGILVQHGRDVTDGGIPFACVGINITAFLLGLVVKRKVDDLFAIIPNRAVAGGAVGERRPLLQSQHEEEEVVNVSEMAQERFNKCYCVLFVLFAKRWEEAKPKDAMGFPHVFNPFKLEVERVLSTSRGLQALLEL
ncbi:hypothetical protein BASA81_002183 [Batrachochytrium salamandrivorans]|nr:hypothetical protein BASA81_002183 [Batrachochytrium salamandrivorans]